jgi:ribosome modulation factor
MPVIEQEGFRSKEEAPVKFRMRWLGGTGMATACLNEAVECEVRNIENTRWREIPYTGVKGRSEEKCKSKTNVL